MYCDISKLKEGLLLLKELLKPIAASIKVTATTILELSTAEQLILVEELLD